MIALGDSIFNTAQCQRCHGKQGVGAQNGPALNDAQWVQISGSYDEIVKVITDGVPVTAIKDPAHRFAMRPRGGGNPPLTDDQVRAVAAYVYSISHK
jgi:mono/diheme cytochrome c family protein